MARGFESQSVQDGQDWPISAGRGQLRSDPGCQLSLSPYEPYGAFTGGDAMKRFLSFMTVAVICQIAFAEEQTSAEPNNLVGTWDGQWSSFRGGGRLEFEIVAYDGERMAGRVNSQAQECTVGWTALSGNRVGEQIHGTYTIGRPCAKVQIVFPIPKANVIEGTWTSEYPGSGTLRLTKKISAAVQ